MENNPIIMLTTITARLKCNIKMIRSLPLPVTQKNILPFIMIINDFLLPYNAIIIVKCVVNCSVLKFDTLRMFVANTKVQHRVALKDMALFQDTLFLCFEL